MADKNILELKADLPLLAQKIGEKVGKIERSIAIELHSDIIQGNPVDTGFSRANWNISIGEPDYTVRGSRTKGASYSLPGSTVATPKDGEPIFIANGVNYVKFLEYGTSKMPPVGFVRAAMARMEQKVASIIAENTEP